MVLGARSTFLGKIALDTGTLSSIIPVFLSTIVAQDKKMRETLPFLKGGDKLSPAFQLLLQSASKNRTAQIHKE
ncbi:MAG TPA: hypothetical protein DCE71_09055 [Parachlamydiales bacterium]|nr:hypothetical protein [Parachlamydiales bacterium]